MIQISTVTRSPSAKKKETQEILKESGAKINEVDDGHRHEYMSQY
jgi:hypothetical protein